MYDVYILYLYYVCHYMHHVYVFTKHHSLIKVSRFSYILRQFDLKHKHKREGVIIFFCAVTKYCYPIESRTSRTYSKSSISGSA